MMKIYQRRQKKNESFHEFFFEMEKLLQTMKSQITDLEKMQIFQHNYKRQMTFLPTAGQKLDALNFSAYNKVFGTAKTVQVVNQESGGKMKAKTIIISRLPVNRASQRM